MEKNSTLVRTSRYVSGGTTEINSTALEWWERKPIQRDQTDQAYYVEKKFENRLDLITATFLGAENARHWWVIAQLNGVLDPHAEITEGVLLYIPTLERFKGLLSGTTGGVASSRVVPTSITPIV